LRHFSCLTGFGNEEVSYALANAATRA
jgi:hypothetical protein